ncbi:MAG: hypothetical protein GTO24_04185 [candidate division Zixibacteria bacterium]|nr:hypothetical protein [candidate division Zixibacteria bacterium]
MSSEYEAGKKAIEGLISWYDIHKASRNEATTRLHLIDQLLFECLLWDKRTDCLAEERFDGTYADYTLLCPRRVLIVEAKREGTYFDIPVGFSNRQYAISTLSKDIPDLGRAINQAAEYCQRRGTPYGAITNGHQLIAFLGSRQDGLATEEGRAIVFESLDAMLGDFLMFWEMLSKPGVSERNLHKKLLATDIPILPKRLSETISDFPGIKNRNVIQTDLQILADLVFEDIISSQELEEEFLRDCYCQSGALSQYALISKSLLSRRYAALFEKKEDVPTLRPATTKKGISEELIAESFAKRPILILGDVGVGKTMFFRHFIKIDAKEVFANALVIYVDFGIQAAFSKDIREYLADEIARQLRIDHKADIYDRSFVRAVYHGELQRFSKGIYGALRKSDSSTYTTKEIEFLEEKLQHREQFLHDALSHFTKGRRKQIVIFLDNADQRSDDVQQQVFVFAQTMAAQWPVAVFLALRPETFQRSKERGSLSAYHLKAFTVSPPRIDQVLAKRLAFGLEITSGRLPVSSLSSGISVDFNKVGQFLSIVDYSIKKSHEVVEAVDNLSGGNVRLALEFIRRLVGSGHIDTRKILEIYEKSERYLIRLHEFLRTVIFGDFVYYDPDSSPLDNLFDVQTLDSREHFLSLILLELIAREGRQVGTHGFVGLETIYDFGSNLGFDAAQIDIHLARLCAKRLVETAGRIQPVENSVSSKAVRITTIGAYHLERLPGSFVYYDAIVTDTPILDRKFREEIYNVADIKDRLDRGELFIDYLDACFRGLDRSGCGFEWSRSAAKARSNITDIRSVVLT